MNALAITVPQVALSVKKTTVLVELICADEYGAQVLFDDIHEKITSDRGLVLRLRGEAAKKSAAPA